MIATRRGYREEYLGRTAVFLIPLTKLDLVCADQKIGDTVAAFLKENYGDSWSFNIIHGVWKGYPEGEMKRFEISFVGKRKIPKLKRFLAQVAEKIGEECIYLLAGKEPWRIYPSK